jgi:hypothetical protein
LKGFSSVSSRYCNSNNHKGRLNNYLPMKSPINPLPFEGSQTELAGNVSSHDKSNDRQPRRHHATIRRFWREILPSSGFFCVFHKQTVLKQCTNSVDSFTLYVQWPIFLVGRDVSPLPRLPATPARATCIARDLSLSLSRPVSSGAVMSGPVLHHLPVDASVHHFNSLDYGFGTGESSFVGSDATCGAVAHCAFSQYLNLEPMRTSVSFADTPGALAAAAPSESGVAQARDASSGDRPMEQQQKKMGVECVTTSGRTGVAEELSTSQTFAEVRLRSFPTLRVQPCASTPRFIVPTTTSGAFSGDKQLTSFRFPTSSRHFPAQAFPPPNFGDMDIQQQADALMSKVRSLPTRTTRRFVMTHQRKTLASPATSPRFRRKATNTSLRLCRRDKKHNSDTHPSLFPTPISHHRDRFEPSPRARSKPCLMNPTSARTRYVLHRGCRQTPPPTARFPMP